MIFVPKRDDLAEDIDAAINIALDLKRRWLLSDDNRRRIGEGLLPSELAIGIHRGKAHINEDPSKHGKDKNRPEGYAINLTKRIEGHSREGRFTRIYVSEAARNEQYLLTDEAVYSLTGPHSVQPKGISQDIRVFEVKHHFLPTDWTEMQTHGGTPRGRSRALLFHPTEEELEYFREAHQANPTNLWLAEEYIMLEMQRAREKLEKAKEQDDPAKARIAYREAELVSRRLSTGDQRDAGILTIRGLVVGEYGEYEQERGFYKQALALDENYPEAHWYLGYSMSYRLFEKLGEQGPSGVPYEKLEEGDQHQVDTILDCYARAIELNPKQAWMHSDYAAELWRWGKKKKAVDMLALAASLKSDVLDHVLAETYLAGIDKEARIRKLLDGHSRS